MTTAMVEIQGGDLREVEAWDNARQFARELGALADWTQIRSFEAMAPLRAAASRAWIEAEDRDCAEGGAP